MLTFGTAALICLAFMVYFLVFQLLSDRIRSGMATSYCDSRMAKLMGDYKVNIRTFQYNGPLQGFAWFKSIWLNERLMHKKKQTLMFTFHHEYYHLKYHHKQWLLGMRFAFSLLPMALMVLPWYVFIPIFLLHAHVIEMVRKKFEMNANAYAHKQLENERNPEKKG